MISKFAEISSKAEFGKEVQIHSFSTILFRGLLVVGLGNV